MQCQGGIRGATSPLALLEEDMMKVRCEKMN
jgi:hypothetical protein